MYLRDWSCRGGYLRDRSCRGGYLRVCTCRCTLGSVPALSGILHLRLFQEYYTFPVSGIIRNFTLFQFQESVLEIVVLGFLMMPRPGLFTAFTGFAGKLHKTAVLPYIPALWPPEYHCFRPCYSCQFTHFLHKVYRPYRIDVPKTRYCA